jgi:hypothetical protein
MNTREAVTQLYLTAYDSLNKHCQEGGGRPTFKLLLDYADTHTLAMLVTGIAAEDMVPEKVAELRGRIAAWEEIRQILSSLLTYQPRKAVEGDGAAPAFPALFPTGPGRVEGM